MELLGLTCFTKRPTKFEQFKKDLNSLELPNSLWALHVDPKFCFAAFLHLDPHSLSTITVDKALVLTFEMDEISSRVYLNGESVVVPELDLKIETVRELQHFLVMFEKLRLCKGNMPDCRKYSKPGHSGDYCVKCSSSKSGFDSLKQNRVCRYKGFSSDIKCEVCGKCFAELSQLKDHSAIHLPSYPVNYNMYSRPSSYRIGSTTNYGNVFSDEKYGNPRRSDMKINERSQSNDYSHPCTFCGESYANNTNPQTHMENSHVEEKPHKCTICDTEFVYPRLSNLHLKKHVDVQYTCSVCGNSFEKKSHLNVHKKTHANKKTYECPTCSKRFKSLGNLNSHKRVHRKDSSVD